MSGDRNKSRFTRENANGTRTVITAAYDYLGRRAWKKVENIATDPETGEETATITLHQRYIYRGYLQVAACDLTRGAHPCLWLITWDPTQPTATRPLGIQKDGTWYAYGWDLTKNICEVFGQAGYIRTTYSYSPYGSAMAEGDVTQPLQWSSEYADPELGLVYYNYRSYNPTDGRWLRRDPAGDESGAGLYDYVGNTSLQWIDILGLKSSIQAAIEQAVLRGDIRTLERLLEIELSAAERQLVREALKELVKEKVKPREKSETKRHRQLQNKVNRTKNNKRGCTKAQSCEELKINLKSMNEHAKARRTINNECYRGVDAGHKKAFIETMKRIKTCEKLILGKCWKCF